MDPTPEEIEQREFTSARRGYEPGEVREFLQLVAEAQRRLAATSGTSFGDVGEQVAAVLASAEQSAREIEATARTQAELLRDEAEAERADEARLRARAEQLLIDAERRAGEVVAEAEHRARERAEAVLAGVQERLDALLAVEREVYERLVAAAADVEEAIGRVGGRPGAAERARGEDALVDSLIQETWAKRASAAGQRIVGTGSSRPQLRVGGAAGPADPGPVVDLTDRESGPDDPAEAPAAHQPPPEPGAQGSSPTEGAGSAAPGAGPQERDVHDARAGDQAGAVTRPAATFTVGGPAAGARSLTEPPLGNRIGDAEELRTMVFEVIGGALRLRRD